MAQAILLSSGNGGSSSDDCTATTDYVVKGKTYIGADTDDEAGTGRLELTGNSAAEHVLSGKTFYNINPLNKLNGTMPNHGAVNHNLNCGNTYVIPNGYHNGSGVITANNLANQTQGTAAASHILSGQTAWVNGNRVTGNMANHGAVNQPLGINGTYTVPAGYHNGGGRVTQNIATFGTQWVTPNRNSQTIDTSGKYGTGNIIVNPIPSNYYDINQSQTVFNNGSYMTGVTMHMYSGSPYNSNFLNVGAARMSGNFLVTNYVNIGNQQTSRIITRQSFPAIYKSIKFTGFGGSTNVSFMAYLTTASSGTASNWTSSFPHYNAGNQYTYTLDISKISGSGYFWIIISNGGTSGGGGDLYISRIELFR